MAIIDLKKLTGTGEDAVTAENSLDSVEAVLFECKCQPRWSKTTLQYFTFLSRLELHLGTRPEISISVLHILRIFAGNCPHGSCG